MAIWAHCVGSGGGGRCARGSLLLSSESRQSAALALPPPPPLRSAALPSTPSRREVPPALAAAGLDAAAGCGAAGGPAASAAVGSDSNSCRLPNCDIPRMSIGLTCSAEGNRTGAGSPAGGAAANGAAVFCTLNAGFAFISCAHVPDNVNFCGNEYDKKRANKTRIHRFLMNAETITTAASQVEWHNATSNELSPYTQVITSTALLKGQLAIEQPLRSIKPLSI